MLAPNRLITPASLSLINLESTSSVETPILAAMLLKGCGVNGIPWLNSVNND
jgi:hypothetical protein